jgi:16S rRNA (cytosine967-C5)-methyltransferase
MTTFRQLHFIKTEIMPKFVKKKIPQKQNILEFILYLAITELMFLNTPQYAVINSYVNVAKAKTDKFGANFVNAVLRNVSKNKDELLANRKCKYFSPDFLKILKRDYSKKEISEMEKFVSIEPLLDISLKSTEDASLYETATILPTKTLRFASNTIVKDIYGFDEGRWWVQDISSSLAVKSLGNIKNKSVLDLCAAPGGKTAQLLDGGAIVTAVDVSEIRLERLKENMHRLKFDKNLEIFCADALSFEANKKFDIILIDAPCSATGTYRRHPEIIHTKKMDDVEKMARLQKQILQNAKKLLKDNGIILYSTCSLSKKEGEKQINEFIQENTNFVVKPISLDDVSFSYTKDGFLRILPQHFQIFYGADGFFVACLQRIN